MDNDYLPTDHGTMTKDILSDEEKYDLADKRSTIQDVEMEMTQRKDEDNIPW